jgi:hypothetical protein
VNAIIDRHAINSAIEFGCGDGNQLAMIHYPSYIGLDISPTAVAVCSRKFAADGTKAFRVYDPATFNPEEPGNRAHLGVSMDVLFHLVEEDVFLTYLKHLFAASDQYVVIYARDVDGPQYFHERNRSFTSRLSEVAPGWRLVEKMASPFHQEARDQAASENVADFFFFEKKVS